MSCSSIMFPSQQCLEERNKLNERLNDIKNQILQKVKGTKYAKVLRLLFKQHNFELFQIEIPSDSSFGGDSSMLMSRVSHEIYTIGYSDRVEGNEHQLEYYNSDFQLNH